MKIKSTRLRFHMPKRLLNLIMRTFIFLFCTTVFSFSTTNSFSQDQVTIYMDQDVSVDEVFNIIQNQTKYRFLYPQDLFKNAPKVHLKKGLILISLLLKQSFAHSDVKFELSQNNTIVVKENPTTLGKEQSEIQDYQVNGTITDQMGQPLIGANVIEKGTTNGTQTDFDGKFSMRVINQNATLVISYMGFVTREENVLNRPDIAIVLQEDASRLDEVVVVGYGTQSKRNLTSAISTISSEELEDRPATNIGYSLEGKAAGVQVIRPSGKPQAGFSIRVRGTTSITAGNDPLYVIDGVPGLSVFDINPDDIDSVTILKDASSAAIYGASGANGVVLITTKKGKNQKPTLSFQMYGGVSEVIHKLDVLNRSEYIDLMQEIGQVTNWDKYTADTNWQDKMFRTANSQNYQLSLTGGTESTKYYLSGSWTEQEGVVIQNSLNRYNFKMSLDQKINDHVTVGSTINFSKMYDRNVEDNLGSNSSGVIMTTLTSSPVIGLYNEDGTFTANPLRMSFHNPAAFVLGTDTDYNRSRVFGNIYLEIDFLKDFTFKSIVGYDESHGKYNYFLDPFRTDWGRTNKGIAQLSFDENILWNLQNTLKYDKGFGEHSVEALVGSITSQVTSEGSFTQTKNFSGISVPTVNGGSVIEEASGSRSKKTNVGFISRLNYSYMDKYLLTANFRADASSSFGPDNKWGYFPSVSAGWRISDEGFFGDSNTINDLKVRAGWGQVGNDGIDPYAWYGQIGAGYNYILGGKVQSGIAPYTPGNRNLKWETTTQTNIGLDASILNNRLSFTADVYRKITEDLLLDKPIAFSSGFTGALQNIGKIKNEGLELSISSKNLINKFKWETDFNISFNRNEVVDIGGQVIQIGGIDNREEAAIIKEGLPIGTFWGYKSLGVDPDTGMIMYETGEDGELNDDDKMKIGDANPDFSLGLTNSFNYKQWNLSIFITAKVGNDIFNATRIETEAMLDFRNQSATVLDRWKKPGQITDVPRAVSDDVSNSRISSRFVEDGSYTRLKSATLSFKLPENVLKNLSLQSASIYVTGENLLTFTKYSGYDPEVSAFSETGGFGIDYGTYPQVREIILGLKFSF